MAIISRKNKFCFIHINNTGGTTITTLLKEKVDDLEILGKRHSTISQALNEIPKIMDYYYKFAYVRNPYDWLVSMFSYITTNDKHPDYDLLKKTSFYEFIQWLDNHGLKRKEGDGLPVYRKQTDFVFKRGEIMVDDLYRYENLCDDTGLSNANTLFLKLGFDMPYKIPVLNKTERTLNWDNLFNVKTYRLVNELFSEDFKNFKYKKHEY